MEINFGEKDNLKKYIESLKEDPNNFNIIINKSIFSNETDKKNKRKHEEKVIKNIQKLELEYYDVQIKKKNKQDNFYDFKSKNCDEFNKYLLENKYLLKVENDEIIINENTKYHYEKLPFHFKLKLLVGHANLMQKNIENEQKFGKKILICDQIECHLSDRDLELMFELLEELKSLEDIKNYSLKILLTSRFFTL